MGLILNNLVTNNLTLRNIPQIVNYAVGANSASTTWTVTQPSQIIAGDLIVYIGIVGGPGGTPTGYTYTAGATAGGTITEVIDQNASPNLLLAYKTAVAADANYVQNWTMSASTYGQIFCMVIRNAAWGAVGTQNIGATINQTVTGNAITTTSPNTLVFGVFGLGNTQGFVTAGPSPTADWISYSNSQAVAAYINTFYKYVATPGSSGTLSSNYTGGTAGQPTAVQFSVTN